MKDIELDEDVLAIFSEETLESGMHPYLAMNFIEKGLKNISYFKGNRFVTCSSDISND